VTGGFVIGVCRTYRDVVRRPEASEAADLERTDRKMASPSVKSTPVEVGAGPVRLAADLGVPQAALGIVVFAHGSGSGRHSPRNRLVAEQLQDRGLATLLLDLLTEAEDVDDRRTRALRFDISMLAERLELAIGWTRVQDALQALPVGLFGASTGAAAALIAAARRPEFVGAVVSRGGRGDLASQFIPAVEAATLLIVGGNDPVVLEMNRQVYGRLRCPKRLEIVPGATHLFEEPGALEQVAALAGNWFVEQLC
jgi:putative phosphoribosyl transferase